MCARCREWRCATASSCSRRWWGSWLIWPRGGSARTTTRSDARVFQASADFQGRRRDGRVSRREALFLRHDHANRWQSRVDAHSTIDANPSASHAVPGLHNTARPREAVQGIYSDHGYDTGGKRGAREAGGALAHTQNSIEPDAFAGRGVSYRREMMGPGFRETINCRF